MLDLARSLPRARPTTPKSVWDLLPADLAALGYGKSADRLFTRLQRPWTWGEAGPMLGAEARRVLAGLDLSLPRVVERRASSDGATKLLLELADGERVEAVHMPRDVRNPRVTLCLSSQVGCAMQCTFCATARMGLTRQLGAAEIVAQVLAILRELGPTTSALVTIVFMGMGEPLHNLEAVVRAVRVLCHERGLGVAPARVTVSTAGIAPGIRALAKADPKPRLALSLNATTDEARERTMPLTRAWGLDELKAALLEWPLVSHEKLTIEYVLLAGENDTDADADRLAAWVRGLRHNVNVIPWNAFEGAPHREPEEARAQAFIKRMRDQGCLVTLRRSRGRDVEGACGQLVTAPPR